MQYMVVVYVFEFNPNVVFYLLIVTISVVVGQWFCDFI